MTQPSFLQNSPPAHFGANAFGYTPGPPPPPWANELLEDMKTIKTKLQSIDEIKQTVNSINKKVSDLESKMKTMDTRISETEKSCQFSASESESNKKDIKTAKDDIKHLKKSCDSFNKTSKELSEKGVEIDKKLCDLESRSMRENLMFYGIQEGGEKEDCGMKVKELLRDILHMENVENILFDRAHRVGQRSTKPRPIVVKFHYYGEREKVRQTSYNCTDELKAANLGIGIQIPKDIREARKPLYPIMKKAKDEGKSVRFNGKTLLINGKEYTSDQQMEH